MQTSEREPSTAQGAQPGRDPAVTAQYLQRQYINVVANFPGGDLGVFTLLLLQIGLLNHVDLEGSRGEAHCPSSASFSSSGHKWLWENHLARMLVQKAATSSTADEMLLGCKPETASGPPGRRGPGVGGEAGGSAGQGWGVSLSALTSSCGRRLMRIRSAFSLSCLLSMRAKRSLEALSW